MAKFDNQLKVLRWGPFIRIAKLGAPHSYDLPNPPILEAKVMEHPLKESLAHPIVSPLHIKLDHHKAPLDGKMSKVMNEFLNKKDIANDAMSMTKTPCAGLMRR